ncbi:MAG: sigma-70 family RNA polymerase sigma factor [Acidimicrobiia bacterium]
MSEGRTDDARLVQHVLDRDEKALEEIYRAHGGAVKNIARRVLSDDTLAEDVVQDVFVGFWNHPEKFDANRGALRTYLLTIAHRRAVDVVRSEVARTQREEKQPPPAETTDLESEIWQRSQSEIVRQAVANLGEDERKAISLAYFGGLTYVEVATALNEPEGTVKSRIRSGMKKLSAVLAEAAT